MKTILFKRVARKLIKASQGGFLRTSAKTMAARIREVMLVGERAGFDYAGPLKATCYPPRLMALGCYTALYFERELTGEISCWVDGAVVLAVKEKERTLFEARIDHKGRLTQKSCMGQMPLPPVRDAVSLGRILGRVEKRVAIKYSDHLPESLSEVYVLTTSGKWLCRSNTGKAGKDAAFGTALAMKEVLRLSLADALCGFVHVCVGKGTLIFNAFGRHIKRMRVYELKETAGKMQPGKLLKAI